MRARTAAGERIRSLAFGTRLACVRTRRYRRLCAAYFVAGMRDKKKLGAMVDLERSALALDTHLIQRLRALVLPPPPPPSRPRASARTYSPLCAISSAHAQMGTMERNRHGMLPGVRSGGAGY